MNPFVKGYFCCMFMVAGATGLKGPEGVWAFPATPGTILNVLFIIASVALFVGYVLEQRATKKKPDPSTDA